MQKIVIMLLFLVIGILIPMTSFADTKKGKLVIWVPDRIPIEGFRKIGKDFEEDTGVKVIVENYDQMDAKFIKEASRGVGPDIILWSHDKIGEWQDNKLIHPIQMSDEYKSRFYDFAIDAMKRHGHIYGYPLSVEAIGLLCNKSLITKNPANFEDFRKIGQKLASKKDDIYPLVFDYRDSYYSFPLMAANGAYVFKKNNFGYDVKDIGINTEGSKIGLQYLKNMVDDEFIPGSIDKEKVDSLFRTGKAACIIAGPWAVEDFDYLGMKTNFSVLPKLNGKPAASFVGITSMMISKASSNKNLAKKLIEDYVLTTDGISVLNENRKLGAVALKSVQKTLEKDKKLANRISVTIHSAKNGVIMPNVPEMGNFWNVFNNAIKNSISGRQTINEALSTAQRSMTKR